jgi:hypothetical protein
MSDQNRETLSDSDVLSRVLELLDRAAPSSRTRILHTVQTFYGLAETRSSSQRAPDALPTQTTPTLQPPRSTFSEDRSISPKEFLLEKRPQTDIEKVACLAYYLTHYLAVENFKTLDISKLNTDAAQIKLSNAAQAVDNATKAGFLIGSVKGQKKLSALGELYVQALPDRTAAREAIAHARPKRRSRSNQKK